MLFLNLKKEILTEISESPEDIIKRERIREGIERRLQTFKKLNDLEFEIFLGGSIAKGTNIRGSDLDLFLLFEKEFDPLSLLRKLKKEFKEGREEYSEHPYIILDFDTFSADIVPAYKLTPGSTMITSVDRTPLHVDFVKNNFTDQMKNEAKILKQFLKGIGVYGAESSVQGFSGYVSELLIYEYGDFENFVKNAAKWKIPYFVNGNISKFQNSSLVILDPVDTQRNAAANVSKENLATLILATSLFKMEYWRDFFYPEIRDFEFPEFGYVVAFECSKCNEEVLIPNLRRVGSVLEKDLDRDGFKILSKSVFMVDKGYLVLIPENVTVNDAEIHEGPPVTNGNVLDFLLKWGRGTRFGFPFIVEDRLYVMREKKIRKFEDALWKSLKKVKLASDISDGKIRILNIGDPQVPSVIKKRFLNPSLGSWILKGIKDAVEKNPKS